LSDKRLLTLYYSEGGSTKRMAELIGEGARSAGVDVDVVSVDEVELDGLVEYDGIAVGSPTYFSNVAWQVKKLIDESIAQYRGGRQLSGKVGGCFTSSGTERDAKDCIRMLELAFGFHHRMEMAPSIIRTPGDSWGDIAEKCREYGEDLARRITGE
jgi:multimeric flavodoxin WrbA